MRRVLDLSLAQIDDFGTGYSLLAYLQRLAVDEIKIDKSFTLGLHEPGNAAIIRSTIELGHNLGLAPHPVLIGLHLTSYVTSAIALWVNRRLPGLLLIAAGGGTNAAVIALNGGTLPASAGALREAGYTVDPSQFKNSGVLVHPVLPWLGDIAATPTWLPFRNVISIGAAVILIGAAVLLHVTCRSRIHHALRFRRPTPEMSSPACVVEQPSSRPRATEGARPKH